MISVKARSSNRRRSTGYRDLGMIQDLRRQYLQPDFSRNTNDLAMALQFYQLRRRSSTNNQTSAELDQVFTEPHFRKNCGRKATAGRADKRAAG